MNLISIVSLMVVAALMNSVDAQWNDGAGGVKWQKNCDYVGGDIGNVRVDGPHCGMTCLNRYGCNHFTYKDGVCYLKTLQLPSRQIECSACDVCGFHPDRNYLAGWQ
jgi:hypothetical protein